MLFDPDAHEPLVDTAWDPAAVEDAIRRIARETEAALRPGRWWPVHPIDAEAGDPETFHGIYMGAAGVLWALHRLANCGLHDPRANYALLAEENWRSYLRCPEFDGPVPSLWMGEGGIALVAWLLSPSVATADRLCQIVSTALPKDTLELMWGSPGLLLIAGVMWERTREPRWSAAWRTIADHLLQRRGERVPELWTQHLYGYTSEILGPAHGSAGVVSILAQHSELFPLGASIDETVAALSRLATRDRALANWAPSLQEGLRHRQGFIRAQWCHGAPGIVTSLALLPPNDELDTLLLAGGELTWVAGPLRKGANLCHGTAGNGFAFLKLFRRAGNEMWLERARRFAMHCVAQVTAAWKRDGHGHYSLWTGDIGTAIYLQQCLAGASEMPGLDAW
jgi:hypothetical protein